MKTMKHRKLSVLLTVLLMAALLLCGCKTGKNETSSAVVLTTADFSSVTETTQESAVPSGESAEQTTTVPMQTEPETTGTPESETPAKTTQAPATAAPPQTKAAIDKNGKYYSKDEVALYIHTYGHLPSNFITKKEAKAAGWTGGSLEPWFPGCVIGGDYFGNYEGLLPKEKGRTYYECDIDTQGKRSRGAKRIIFSNDGYIYYTDDHYESFTELYKGGAS